MTCVPEWEIVIKQLPSDPPANYFWQMADSTLGQQRDNGFPLNPEPRTQNTEAKAKAEAAAVVVTIPAAIAFFSPWLYYKLA